MSIRTQSLLSLFLLLALPATLHAANRVATDDELQQMFDLKQFRACLQQSARVLQLRGPAAQPYDLFTIHMRRGECFLNLDDMNTAVVAFSTALARADTPAQADQARAIIALIKACNGGHNYTPANNTLPPINIILLPTRAAAYKAFFTDRFASAAPDIQTALNATSLVPLIKFVPVAHELHALEFAALGTDPQTRPLLLALGEKARDMMTTELQSLDYRIASIEKQADALAASGNNIVTQSNGTQLFAADTRIGLSSDDRNYLRQQIPYLTDILTASKRGKQTAQSFGATGEKWDPVIQSATQTLQHAQSVLDAD